MGERRQWRVNGYDSTDPTLSEVVEMTESEVKELLRRLVCEHLTADEIIAASTGAISHLEASRVANGWMTNGNPHYIATAMEPDE